MLEKRLVEIVKKHSDKTAIAYDNLRISYQEFYVSIIYLSNHLSKIGIVQGDCIALILPNILEFAIAFYATAKLNAITLPINPLLKEDELKYYIIDSNARAIITNSDGAELSRKIISKIDKKIELVVLDDTALLTIEVNNSIITESTSTFSGVRRYAFRVSPVRMVYPIVTVLNRVSSSKQKKYIFGVPKALFANYLFTFLPKLSGF